jgi:hypothetical protein
MDRIIWLDGPKKYKLFSLPIFSVAQLANMINKMGWDLNARRHPVQNSLWNIGSSRPWIQIKDRELQRQRFQILQGSK